MHGIVVFLGPSLDPESARAILDATYLPPARRGDIQAAASGGAGVIVLIDGVFFQDCAVAHREILAALRAGVRVVGASSMGALRAAELDTLGMEGVGEIYRAYRDGKLVADDEVALVFDPETGTALSEPLVNIRATLDRAVNEGVLTPDAARAVLDAGRRLYFPERTYDSVADAAEPVIGADAAERFRSFAEGHAVDQKRTDAVAALTSVRETAEQRRKT
ncbi:TfuA-related McrA-glycine thioamidation protein [Methanoculleus sp. FWC-SCC1]|uniref:TfuA-related McrA-glycine thioamidation protein n=1 Tax=Methanoculleus frigidifontis TaxID=2584085 RepID=A0ABT8MDF5_9EURY|nr:TfuA-related McrA-glycine thioamidation protein [Methanoculleus sp. FWC-SCC1]MDN7025967.1 TfuA-related McrA-glycine thioamidation protein [Methanoculleus sp. FWC-SCC1]